MYRPALVLALVLAGAAVAPPSAPAEEFEEHLSLDSKTLHLANIVGEIRIEGHEEPGFQVDVRVRGKDASHDVRVMSQRTASGAEVMIRFPLDQENHYVYPPMGRSKTTFHPRMAGVGWFRHLVNSLAGTRVTVSGEGDGREVWADVVIKVPRGASLAVRNGAGTMVARDVSGDLSLDSQTGRVAVSSLQGGLSVDTGSGGVEAAGIRGAVDIDTGSGGVTLRDVEGPVHVDTGSGSLEFERCRGDEMAVDTGSGGATLSGIAYGEVSVNTGSGSIELGLVRPVSARIAASTGSGGISVDLDDVRVLRNDVHDKEFEAGSGEARITLETGSGSIRVTA